MRPIDWGRLLREHRVPYAESGPNVKRGELAIKCPFCGSADPSMHMGLNLDTGWWSCWRNRAQHSGKSPLRLLMKLLRVPYGRAREIAGLGDDYVDPEGFDAMAARLMGRIGSEEARPGQVQRRFLELDSTFIPIRDQSMTRMAWEYLYDRGFNGASDLGEDVDVLCAQYGLRTAIRGEQAGRIVLPYFMDGELVTWSGRAIGKSTIRYKDLPRDEVIVAAKETLYNHDAMLRGGKVLVIVEGPFDALKLDFYGKPWGVRAVALSTNSVSDEQAFLLQAAEDRFERVLVMLDNASTLGIVDSMRMRQELHFLKNLAIVKVPSGAKDAGDLTPKQVITWAQAL
jgi:hypothetical protein